MSRGRKKGEYLQDHTGERYGRLTIIRRDKNFEPTYAKWICRCDCGRLKSISYRNMRAGNSTSCGSKACKPNSWTGANLDIDAKAREREQELERHMTQAHSRASEIANERGQGKPVFLNYRAKRASLINIHEL